MKRETLYLGATLVLLTVLFASPVMGATGETFEDKVLMIATTTSLDDTGLLDLLGPRFEQDIGDNVVVRWLSKGTGISLEYGKRGDVDLMMVHDRAAEDKFIDEGYGQDRRVFAYNYFVLVGPESDPAEVAGMSPADAFNTIMEKGQDDSSAVKFVSRGDNSGTHSREKAIWKSAGYEYADVQASGDWYVESGQGMGSTLRMADEMDAYTISDMGTFLAYRGDIGLVSIVESGDDLLNIYSAILVNPEMHPSVNTPLGAAWINFLLSDEVQELISNFGVEEYGKALFYGAQGSEELLGISVEETSNPVNVAA
jgi:tungstate transport system substrate-binding protein